VLQTARNASCTSRPERREPELPDSVRAKPRAVAVPDEAKLESPRAVVAVVVAGAVVVTVLVGGVILLSPRSASVESDGLADVNAALNAAAALCLGLGYACIRRGSVAAHRFCMLSALALSAAFLASYLLHHARVGSVPFPGTGVWRAIYLTVLIPHIVLSALVVPLALLTVYRAFRRRFEQHKRLARVTLPIWLYVSVSGVLVYVMLYRVAW